MSIQGRVPAGIPSGGQFAVSHKAESGTTLDAAPSPAPCAEQVDAPLADVHPDLLTPSFSKVGGYSNRYDVTVAGFDIGQVRGVGATWYPVTRDEAATGASGRRYVFRTRQAATNALIAHASGEPDALGPSDKPAQPAPEATEADWSIDAEQRRAIARQIGTGNILSISGGRVTALKDGIELPVSSGYRVRVRLTPGDDYTVSRVMVRGGKEFPKGEKTGVYCDNVGEQAYRAGMFRSYGDDEW